jgi:hypothetical protein
MSAFSQKAGKITRHAHLPHIMHRRVFTIYHVCLMDDWSTPEDIYLEAYYRVSMLDVVYNHPYHDLSTFGLRQIYAHFEAVAEW